MQRTPAFCNGRLVVAVLLGSLAFCSPPAWCQSESSNGDNPLAGVDIAKIEEDWLLDIADPEANADCPQVVTVFGPADPSCGTHAIFEMNHGTQPEFSEGGMQLQAWHSDYLVGYRSQFAPAEFDVAIERITFTTLTRVRENWLKLAIINGESLTWGNFGGTSSLRIDMTTWRENLNDWDAQHSIAHSRVSYGANRVNKFLRTEIRYYTRVDGQYQLHYTDETDTYIHRLVEDQYAPGPIGQ